MLKMKTMLLASAAVVAMTGATFAADLIIEEPVIMPGVVDVGGDWEGFYIGVHAGYAWGDADHTSLDPGNDLELSGWLVGLQAGYNAYLTDGIVGGIEADVSWANISGEEDFAVGLTEHSIDWQGSLRAKLGFDAGAFMPYLTAGVAFAGATRENFDTDVADSQTHIGWTAGVGADIAVADNMSLNLEYRYSDFGDAEYDTGGTPPTIDLDTHQFRVGLNWGF